MPPPHRRRTARRASCAQGSRYGVCVRERRRGPGRGLWPGLARARLPTSSAASARHARAQRAQACRAPPPATRGERSRRALRVDCERRGNARRLHGGRDTIAHARATGLARERGQGAHTVVGGVVARAPPWLAQVGCNGHRRPALGMLVLDTNTVQPTGAPWRTVASACGARVEHERRKRSAQLLRRVATCRVGCAPPAAAGMRGESAAPARARRRPTGPSCCRLSHRRSHHRRRRRRCRLRWRQRRVEGDRDTF